MERTLVYISDFGGESQVLNLLKQVERDGYFKKIFLLTNEKNDDDWHSLLQKKEGFDFQIIRYKTYPNYHFFKSFQLVALKESLKQILSDNTIIHLRGGAFSAIVKRIVNKLTVENVKIITDVRGASYEEILLYSKIKQPLLQLKLYHLKKNLKSIGPSSDYVSCVSSKLKEYVLSKTNIDRNRIFINHCIAGGSFKYSEEIRKEYRAKLNLTSDDVLFLFVTGGNAPWQNTERIIRKIASSGYKILNLSRKKIENENVINLFVPYTEVPNYLNSADISVVWRNDDVVNNVAAPIKFSEYVCSGLPVIANNGVDLINNYIKETGFGATVNDINELDTETIEKLIVLDRKRINDYGDGVFSLDVVSKQYLAMYKEALES